MEAEIAPPLPEPPSEGENTGPSPSTTPRRRRWVKWLIRLVVSTGILIVALVITFIVIYQRVKVPEADAAATAQAAVITYSNGEVMARVGPLDREDVPLAKVPGPVRNAVLAAEDDTFYENHGFRVSSIARAAISTARGSSEGGSTITQQYVKNLYDRREHSLGRKASELVLAMKLNRQRSKDDILQGYLNTIYWGRGAYGIQSAAQAYFHVNADRLSVSQGAFLAGIINAPEASDPADGGPSAARAQRRWGVVLDAMVRGHSLSPGERAGQEFPKVRAPRTDSALGGQTGYLVTMVESEVRRRLHLSDEDFRTDGYRIVTTFDRKLMTAAEDSVEASLPPRLPKNLQVGLASVDPGTGAVRALYGGPDFLERQQNAATQDSVEAAGTFSPFTLITALKAGFPLDAEIAGPAEVRIDGETIDNFRGRNYGTISLSQAGSWSANTALAALIPKVGTARFRKDLYAAGISPGASISGAVSSVLGAASVHPLSVAKAYATLAAQGVRHETYVVQSVTDTGSGAAVLTTTEDATRGTRVFPASVTREVGKGLLVNGQDSPAKMRNSSELNSESYASRVGQEVAVQSGTSSSYRSAWMAGYTPELSTAVALYQLTPQGRNLRRMEGFGRYRHITGDSYPGDIWAGYLARASKGS